MPKAKTVLIAALMITTIAFFSIAQGAQDFGISQNDITVSKVSPVEGENITINVLVHYYNINTIAFANLTVYLDEINTSKILGYKYFSVPSGNGTKLISFYWNTSFQAGDHTIIAKLHRFNFGEEITDVDGNLSNNIANRTIHVRTRADLTLTKEDISFSNQMPNEGEQVKITAKIVNNGETTATNVKIAFYNNTLSDKIGEAIITINANSFSSAQITWDTTNEYGNHWIIVFADYTNETNETNENNNIAQNTIKVRNYEKDMIVDGMKITEIKLEEYVQTGFIFVQDNGILKLPNTILNIWQRWENQFDIVLEDNGKIVIENATIKDYDNIYSFNIYFFNQTEMRGNKATIKANITGDSDSGLYLSNSLIQGNVNLTCKEFSLFYASVETIIFNLTAEKISINDSALNTIQLYLNPTINLYSKNSSFNQPLDDFKGNSISHLLNTTISAPTQSQISVNEGALVWRYWYFTVEVRDDAFLPIKNAKVSILYYPKPFLLETIYKVGYTDKNGRVVFVLESDNFTYQGRIFLGNYNLTVEYKNIKIFKRDVQPMHDNIFVDIELGKTLISPEDVYKKTERDINLNRGEEKIDAPYPHQGNLILEDNSTLLIENATLKILQKNDYEYFILLKDNATIILENGMINSDYKIILYLYGNSKLILNNNSILNSTVIARYNSKIFIRNSVFEEEMNTKCSLIEIEKSTIKGDMILKAEDIKLQSTNIISNSVSIETNSFEIKNSNISVSSFSFKAEFFNSTNSSFNKNLLFSANTIATLTNTSAIYTVSEDAIVYIYWYLTLIAKDKIENYISNVSVKIFSFRNLVETLYENTTTDIDGKVIVPLLAKIIDRNGSYYYGNYKALGYFLNYTTEKISITVENQNLIKEIKFNEALSSPASISITIDDYSPKEIFVGDKIVITGYVRFSTNAPVENAGITLYINSVFADATTTDAKGFYRFEILINNKGEVRINVSAIKELKIGSEMKTYINSNETIISVKEKPIKVEPINWMMIGISLAIMLTIISVVLFYFRERIKLFLSIFYARYIKKEEMAECGECKKLIQTTATKCPYCGAEFEKDLIRCSKCSAMIPLSAEKCEFCGAEFKKEK